MALPLVGEGFWGQYIPGLPPGAGQILSALAQGVLQTLGGMFSSYPDAPAGFHYVTAYHCYMKPTHIYGPPEMQPGSGMMIPPILSTTWAPAVELSSHILEDNQQGWPVARIRKNAGQYNAIPLIGLTEQGYPVFDSHPTAGGHAEELLQATFPPRTGAGVAKNVAWSQLAGLPGPAEEPSEGPAPAVSGRGSAGALGDLAGLAGAGGAALLGASIGGMPGALVGFLIGLAVSGLASPRAGGLTRGGSSR